MSFANEMRRKSLEAQSIAAEKARAEEAAEEAKALALEESKRNNCIPNLKKDIQQAASNGLCEVIIKGFVLEDWNLYYGEHTVAPSRAMIKNLELNSFLENLELNPFLKRGSSTLDEYDKMRIAFIKAEPGLSLKLVYNFFLPYAGYGEPAMYSTSVSLMVVW